MALLSRFTGCTPPCIDEAQGGASHFNLPLKISHCREALVTMISRFRAKLSFEEPFKDSLGTA